MSVIKLKCIEQTLTIVNSPTISSGNVNYDQVNFTFCDTWSGFTKTAIFYRNENEVYEKILNSAGTCTIPKEVLKTKGIFFIGVFGVKDNVVITSQVISYRINQGAITENLMPPDPTPDIYAQILAEFGDVRDVYEDFKKTLVEMDNTIVISHDYEYPNSKPGGLKVNYIEGASVQNGEPSPSNPIAIENVGDYVEIENGDISSTTGAYLTDNSYVRTKRFIPCSPNDVINVKTNIIKSIFINYFNESGFVVTQRAINTNEATFEVPSGATKFIVSVGRSGDTVISPEEIAIKLTVNGKHVVQIVEHWKNILGSLKFANSLPSPTIDSVAKTVTVKSASIGSFSYENFKENTQYTFILKGYNSAYETNGAVHTNMAITYTDGTKEEFRFDSNKMMYFVSDESKTIAKLHGVNYGYNSIFYYEECGIFEGVLSLEDFEPYTEKVATIFLDEPLREGDRLVKVYGVINQNRKRGGVDLSTLTWTLVNDKFWQANAKSDMLARGNKNVSNVIAEKYMVIEANYISATSGTNKIALMNSTANEVKKATYIYCNNGSTTEKPSGLMEYELVEETFTPLDTQSQIALNGLETFKDMTYLEVDSKIKPSGIEVEYGVTRDAGYTLKSLLNSESNAIKIDHATKMLLAISQT